MGIEVIGAAAPSAKEKRIDVITATGNWTAPAGVTYAIAYARSGGGGGGSDSPTLGTAGGATEVFGVSINGGARAARCVNADGSAGTSGAANTGEGGTGGGGTDSANDGKTSTVKIISSTVIPGNNYPITIGAGGSGGGGSRPGGAGGSGRVEIEYYV